VVVVTPVLVLVGPPGSGKTTVGRVLATVLRVPFRDTDADVETAAARPIRRIFAEDGEQAFRVAEERAVRAALGTHDGVLALGGGAVLSARTRELLTGQRVAFLNMGLVEAMSRTGRSTARPLLAGADARATLRDLLATRVPWYREVATVEIGTDHRTPVQVADAVLHAFASDVVR
jgi:shikimate kinase